MLFMTKAKPSKIALLFAYLMVYLIWGSTYLAIRFSVETIPPILSGGIRFLSAGFLLLTFRMIQSGKRTTLDGWKYAFVASLLPFVVTYASLTIAETIVPSSVAGLLVALEPLWFCILGWAFFKGPKPTKLNYLGIISGFIGVYYMAAGNSDFNMSINSKYTFGIMLVILSSLAWVFGAFISRNPKVHEDSFMSSAMQMLCGGGIMMVIQFVSSAFTGNYPVLGAFSMRSSIALGYLIIFGSLVAYTSFMWLMRVEPANHVATVSFVNPIIAVFLGFIIGGEPLHMNMIIATPLIITAVILMVWQPKQLQ